MPGFYLAAATRQTQQARLCPNATYSPGGTRVRSCIQCQSGLIEEPAFTTAAGGAAPPAGVGLGDSVSVGGGPVTISRLRDAKETVCSELWVHAQPQQQQQGQGCCACFSLAPANSGHVRTCLHAHRGATRRVPQPERGTRVRTRHVPQRLPGVNRGGGALLRSVPARHNDSAAALDQRRRLQRCARALGAAVQQ